MAAIQSKHSLSVHHDEPTTSLRKKYKTPVSSSSNFKPHHPAAAACNLTPSQTARITQQFDQSLIACVVGKKIHRRLLTSRLRSHLHLTGNLDVFELGLGFFVLKFSNSLDYYQALEERPWSISHLCIHVFPWIPNFKPSEASIPFVDVWIRLPELSLEYYDKEVFEEIAKAIGVHLVKVDPVTETLEKCIFARICIRITLCNPLILSTQIGPSQQKIEYEGFDYVCPVCGCVDDLKHDCLNQSNPSGSSGFDPHQHNPCSLQAIDPTSSSVSNSLIHSVPSSESILGSKSQEKSPFLDLKLKECPRLKMGKVVENEKKTLPNFPKESSTTVKTPESKHTNLIQSVPLAPSVVVDQFRAPKTSRPATLAFHKNESQPSSALETDNFFLDVIRLSTTEKEMINTPSGVNNVDGCPTVYTIGSTTTSLGIDLSEAPTTTGSNQNQYTTNFVLTFRGEKENEVDSEAVSMPALCSKKMLCWNFRWTDNAKLIQASKDLIRRHEPSIVLIFGSKISSADADQVVQELTFDGLYRRKPDGYNGGVWILLSRQDVQIEVSSHSPQKVSVSLHFHSKPNEPELYSSDEDTETSPQPWGATFFYASTRLMDMMTMACANGR